MHRDNVNGTNPPATNLQAIYGYMTGAWSDAMFPDAAPNSTTAAPKFLGMPKRLFVSGYSRELSAMRLRQVRRWCAGTRGAGRWRAGR